MVKTQHPSPVASAHCASAPQVVAHYPAGRCWTSPDIVFGPSVFVPQQMDATAVVADSEPAASVAANRAAADSVTPYVVTPVARVAADIVVDEAV